MITEADVVLALSYSGESDEVLMLLPVLKRQLRELHDGPLRKHQGASSEDVSRDRQDAA